MGDGQQRQWKQGGEGGCYAVRVNSVKAVDGQKVRLRASKSREGDSNTGKVVALTILVSPLFLLMRGNSARIKPGTSMSVFTDQDKNIVVCSHSTVPTTSRRRTE